MNKIAKLVIISLIVGGIGYYIYRDNRKNEVEAKKLEKINKDVYQILYNETYTLLSLKYNVDKDKVYNLINEYEILVLGFPDDLAHFKFDYNEKTVEASTAIDNLSKKYGIPKEIIANIIFDQKVLEGVNKCGS
jgi:hypothetical protein